MNTDDPKLFGYGGMIPPYLPHVEQSLQRLQIDLPFIFSKTLQCSQNVSLEEVEGNIELIEIVFIVKFSIIK